MFNQKHIKEIKLALLLMVSVSLGVLIVQWGNEPDFRPLIQDVTLTDSVKISDILEQNQIRYRANVKNKILYVDQAQTELAKVALAKHGITIDYPDVKFTSNMDEAYNNLLKSIEEEKSNRAIWEESWFHKQVVVLIGVLCLVLFVFRPIISSLTKDYEQSSYNQTLNLTHFVCHGFWYKNNANLHVQVS